ncbi:hypothetical protein [Nannocystis pusilla]|uniref:hypothetical protein n=1 Tax=Nannocystis pusilla TaxID=889268 RepID=UPI003DA440F2
MAAIHNHHYRVAYFEETTVGTPPNGATWNASGVPIETTMVDVSGLKQEFITDPTLEEHPLDMGTRAVIHGIKNGQIKVGLKLHGTGAATEAASQVAANALSNLLKHAWGGVHRSSTTAVAAATDAKTFTVDSATNIIPGCVIGVQDTSSPSAEYSGVVVPRRVLSVTDTEIVLEEDLPFTPAADDVVHAAITVYLDHSALEDAVASNDTLSWLIALGHESGTDHLYQVVGSVISELKIDLPEGGVPGLEATIECGTFMHGTEDGLSNPDFATATYGHAQLAIGRNTKLSIGEYGADTLAYVDATAYSLETGVGRQRVKSITERTHNLEATATYGLRVDNTTLALTFPTYEEAWYSKLNASTVYRLTLAQHAAPGKGWGLFIPKAQIEGTPGRQVVVDNWGAQVSFRAARASNATGGSNNELERSRILLALF